MCVYIAQNSVCNIVMTRKYQRLQQFTLIIASSVDFQVTFQIIFVIYSFFHQCTGFPNYSLKRSYNTHLNLQRSLFSMSLTDYWILQS